MGFGYPRSVDLNAFGRIAAGVNSTLVMTGVLRIANPFRVDDLHVRTSHRDHRPGHGLIALVAAGFVVAGGSGRSTASPPVAPDSTATSMATTAPAPPTVPTTTLTKS